MEFQEHVFQCGAYACRLSQGRLKDLETRQHGKATQVLGKDGRCKEKLTVERNEDKEDVVKKVGRRIEFDLFRRKLAPKNAPHQMCKWRQEVEVSNF